VAAFREIDCKQPTGIGGRRFAVEGTIHKSVTEPQLLADGLSTFLARMFLARMLSKSRKSMTDSLGRHFCRRSRSELFSRTSHGRYEH
jgi:hypothetical protein